LRYAASTLRSRHIAPAFALLALPLLPLTGCASCASSGQGLLWIMPDEVVNDPSNLTLRKAILAFGISQFCGQMTTHGAPLRMTEDSPIIGRFYPTSCTQQELQNGDLYVQFTGFGYGYTNLSKKLTFTMNGAVEYGQDFQKAGSTMYVYFRPRRVVSSEFKSHVVEQPVASFLNSLSSVGDNFGRQLVSGKLAEGFTVIRESNGSADFGLGVIDVGKRPFHPFDVHGTDRVTIENARTEVHQNERDFIGPIVVEGSGRALYLSAQMDGVQAMDLLLLRKAEADASLRYYFDYPVAGPLAGAPTVSDIVQVGIPFQHAIPVPAGTYYVVLDNTPSAGTVAPPMNALDDRAALVNYVVQIGDAP
jgi:hypothetical protein